jgi:hypothetical protein
MNYGFHVAYSCILGWLFKWLMGYHWIHFRGYLVFNETRKQYTANGNGYVSIHPEEQGIHLYY